MSKQRKVALWVIVLVIAAGGAVAAVLIIRAGKVQPITIEGAVISRNADVNKQQPITGAVITVADGLPSSDYKSDSSGFFRLTLPKQIRRGDPILLEFQHPGYKPFGMKVLAGTEICIARMRAISTRAPARPGHPEAVVSNVSVRYSVKATTDVDVGSVAKTFQVVNTGNVPCNGGPHCSPGGRWKAVIHSFSLVADEGNLFRNPRLSCIAGPCPFTKIVSDQLSEGGRKISITVRNWSDTTTFLVEAEVVHPMASDSIRVSYPVKFGQALNFTVPVSAEGVSIEAEVNKDAIVFPLGPDLFLRWASCVARVTSQTRAYRCELKRGYRF